ncbi:restriction alleviation protein, Lar family [candidate division WWE3 bacterium]|uniref:Restriction alleviation protein, Lar family n=1 Tax=candidate division WWE3 bacterium TaxID=2053526 RepID=A0A7X9HGY8_UNCKA|nr:restriction alleviation protein, Lar family [candidate division WWE3 bacterium]
MEDMTDVYQPKEDEDLKLLPCPFCGSHDIVYMKYNHAAGERWAVVCMGCMADIDPGWAQQKHQVQDLWNRRM